MVGGGMASMQALVTFFIVFTVLATVIGIIVFIAKKVKAKEQQEEKIYQNKDNFKKWIKSILKKYHSDPNSLTQSEKDTLNDLDLI